MWLPRATSEFLTHNSPSIIRHWRTDAKKELWHLPREQFDRGGELRKHIRSTLGYLVTYFEAMIVEDDGKPTNHLVDLSGKSQSIAPVTPIVGDDLAWPDLECAWNLLAASVTRILIAANADAITLELAHGFIIRSLCGYATGYIAQQEHELNERLEKSLVTKHLTGRFLANVSHDLRTPLTAVLGFTELLQEDTYGPLNQAQRQAIDHIVNSGQNLLETINNLIDLFQLREGQLKPVMRPCGIYSLITELTQITAPLAQRHNINIATEIDPDIPVIIVDETILRHIVYNLLTTLIRASPGGGTVVIMATTTSSTFTLRITENSLMLPSGAGLQLLDAYNRRENEPLVGSEGWGTGLSLVQRYVEVHLGQMQISPVDGGGVEFVVTLPTRTANPVT